MKIAILGCCHGSLDLVFQTLGYWERIQNVKIDLLICCGDFQAIRNHAELSQMACPPKYRAIGDFIHYFQMKKRAPYTTIFICGNHESATVLRELHFGGWVAPNIFFLGRSGVINVNGIRIAGLSGIFKRYDMMKGYFEAPPFSQSDIHSICHMREFDIQKLMKVTGPVDIMVTHDWPEGIYDFGDRQWLARRKPHFREEMSNHSLGNPRSTLLLDNMRPKLWFSAHLHVKFTANKVHADGSSTRFLALDKPLRNREFAQILGIEPAASEFLTGYSFPELTFPGEAQRMVQQHRHSPSTDQRDECAAVEQNRPFLPICFDKEWLAILKANYRSMPMSSSESHCIIRIPNADDKRFVEERLMLHCKKLDQPGGGARPDSASFPSSPSSSSSSPPPPPPPASSSLPSSSSRISPQPSSSYPPSSARSVWQNDDRYLWPAWDEIDFTDLIAQRRFILKLIGEEGNDLLALPGSEGPRETGVFPNITQVPPPPYIPDEEIDIDLDGIC